MTTEIILRAIIVGVGATALMDLWALLRHRVFAIPSLDYALVGRWLGHLRSGRLYHPAIAKATAVQGERALGWACHYLIGVLFAGLMLLAVGGDWLCRPAVVPALTLGVVSVAAPFLLMQPAFGMGLAASRLANPWRARLRSLVTHLVFGMGLYAMGWLSAQWYSPSFCPAL